MHEWGDSGITAVLLAIGVALLLSLFVTQQARTRAARYKEIRRLQFVAAEEARREEQEAQAEYTSMVARNFCAVCSNPSTTRCSRCKAVRYCSSTCQAQHWKDGHKQECRAPDPVPSPVSSSNGSRIFSDVYSSNGSSGSGGSRTLPEVSEVRIVEDATAPAESAKTPPASNGNGVLARPKKVLFPYEYFVKLFNWERLKVPPCGLLNCGNSCFANVVLQCLTYTRPLTGYLLEGTHGEECGRGDWCFMCELQDHVWRVRQNQNPFSPIRILSRIRNIGNHLGYGRQEDAHEFMRFAIDSMQSICLDEAGGEKNIDPRSQETTFIHYIFGGHLQSQVKCMQCLHESNRYENMMDLAVEIQGCVETLEDALTQFTAPEWLDGENKYKCDRCNAYVKARKRLTLHEAPNILTIALKRFQSGKFGKLNKRVTFPEVLDVSPYMSGKGDRPPLYRLYAVVVHVDMLNASFFGHYICYVKDSQGLWYKIDDSKVKEVDIEKVLAQRAYMLFYTRSIARPPPLSDGAVSPYPVGEAADLGRVDSARHEDIKVFPGSQYVEREEMIEGAGARGLHAMVDFNQMLDYVDGNRETVSEHILSNGEISTTQPSSWEVERVRSSSPNDDEIELEEDAGCVASSSSLTQTSPYMSSFTSNQGLWIPTQGYVCQVPESAMVDGPEYVPWDPKSSLPDDFSEVSLQPCTAEQPCNTKIGKRRLEDGLSPLPTPKPLDTDQLPAWPIGSPGRSNPGPPPVNHLSAIPISSSVSEESHSVVQNYELAGEPLSLETFSTQKMESSDLVCLPALRESSPESEMTEYMVVETTDSGNQEIAARAKRQHVELERTVDPIFVVQRPDEILKMEHSNSCNSGVRDMDWDPTSQHAGALTVGAEPGEEIASADASKASSNGQVIWNQQVSLPSGSEGSESRPQEEALEVDKFEEPHESSFVTLQSSEALQLGSQRRSGLQEEVLGTKISFPEVTTEVQASQLGVQDAILETGLTTSGLIAQKESDSSKHAPSTAAQALSSSVAPSDGPALEVADKPRPKASKSISKPIFAPGFLNKARTPTGPKVKSNSNTSSQAAVLENGHEEKAGDYPACENGTAKDETCSCSGKSHVQDINVSTKVDQLRPTQGISVAAVSDDTPTAPNGKVSSCGNCMNCEICNSAKLDSLFENGHQTESVTAPDTKDNELAKIVSKNDLGSSSKSTRQNASANGNGSSFNSLQVNIDEEPSVEPVSEAVAVSGRPATGKQKQGRNETCNCGSQLKWKKCCGKTGVIKPELGRKRLVV